MNTQTDLGTDRIIVNAATQARPSAEVPAGVQGRMELRFRATAAHGVPRTVVDTIASIPPLRVIRAFPQDDGAALIHLHNTSGGILGGDQLTVEISLEPGTRAQVTTTGATRVYRHRSGHPVAEQATRFTVAPGALLEFLPDPVIPFSGSRYRQRTEYALGQGAGLFTWEIVFPGREAAGERFAYQELAMESLVLADGLPIAMDRFDLQPGVDDLHSPVALGAYRSFCSLFLCKIGEAESTWSRLEEQLSDLADDLSDRPTVVWGVSTLVADGLVVRGLAREGRMLVKGAPRFWQAAKRRLYHLDAVMPRKVY